MISVMVAEDSIEENSTCCEFLAKDKDIEITTHMDAPVVNVVAPKGDLPVEEETTEEDK